MEYAMLQRRFDAKRAKNQKKDENVVQTEGFFHHIAGKEFQSGGAAVSLENPEIKGTRQQYPNRAPRRRFSTRHALHAARNSYIECHRGDAASVEPGPPPRRPHH